MLNSRPLSSRDKMELSSIPQWKRTWNCGIVEFLQFCPLSTIPGSKNFWSRNCAQFPKKVELCSIPVPWAQGILVSTGNRAQFQVELWMGIELKGRNCGWELSSRDGIAEIYGTFQLMYLWQSQRFIVKREEITWSQGMGIELNSPVETKLYISNLYSCCFVFAV